MVFLSSLIGIKLQERTGLCVSHFKAWMDKKKQSPFSWKWIGIGIFVSFLGALLILFLDSYVFLSKMDVIGIEEQQMTWWHGVLAVLYGGITEEIFLRLFVMTMLVWLLATLTHIPSSYFWIGIIFASLLFGAGYLPATVGAFGEWSAVVVVRAFVLNGVLGIWFGYLYWKKRLEYAMVSHMAADIFLLGNLLPCVYYVLFLYLGFSTEAIFRAA